MWLVSLPGKRLWLTFLGRDDEGCDGLTDMGQVTRHALDHLPGVTAPPTRLIVIEDWEALGPQMDDILRSAADHERLGIVSSVEAHDGDDLKYMAAQGRVAAAVELNASGWPVEFEPMLGPMQEAR